MGANDFGREFEEQFAKSLSSYQQRGSGSGQWAKMDVRGNTVLWSCKAVRPGAQSITFSRYDFDEVKRSTTGPGGTGDLPGMAFKVDGTTYLTLELNDFLTLMGSDVTIAGDKATQRRRASAVPAALRGSS